MELRAAKVLLTGASSGIGWATALALAEAGARLALVGRNEAALGALGEAIRGEGGEAHAIVSDLTAPDGPRGVVDRAVERLQGLDVLINNAGVSFFGRFEAMSEERLVTLIQTNLAAPVLLTRAVLPRLLAQGSGRIVNIGSVFGSIGFAYFTAYSASKFAMRGFSEALRRELEGSGVGVCYVAPRATRTPLNGPAMTAMAAAVAMPMDPPARVAARIVMALRRDRKETIVGGAEGFFARLNGALPRLIDRALASRNRVIGRFAENAAQAGYEE